MIELDVQRSGRVQIVMDTLECVARGDNGEDHRRGFLGVVKEANKPRELKRARRDRGSTAKERISKMPPCVAGKRSSIYRGVTRHRWTGRYEAHLWDKRTWNQNQNKKGKQVYLGAYDEEEAAARAYDLAALKYWGPGTLINFPVSDYARDIDEMQNLSKEDYLASLRRKSSSFTRGLSKFRTVTRQNVPHFGHDVSSTLLHVNAQGSTLEVKDASSVAAFNLSSLFCWLQKPNATVEKTASNTPSVVPIKSAEEAHSSAEQQQQSLAVDDTQAHDRLWQCCEPYQLPSLGLPTGRKKGLHPPALDLVLQSFIYKQMLQRILIATPRAEKGMRITATSDDNINTSTQSQDIPFYTAKNVHSDFDCNAGRDVEKKKEKADFVFDSIADCSGYFPT